MSKDERLAKLVLFDLYNSLIKFKPDNCYLTDRDEWIEAWLEKGRQILKEESERNEEHE